MSGLAKFSFFLLALVTMGCLAGGSVMMAEAKVPAASSLFVVALVLIVCGFVVRKRLLRR